MVHTRGNWQQLGQVRFLQRHARLNERGKQMAWIDCNCCGKGYDNDYPTHITSGECARWMASRQMEALESIAESLAKYWGGQ